MEKIFDVLDKELKTAKTLDEIRMLGRIIAAISQVHTQESEWKESVIKRMEVLLEDNP